MNFEQLIDGVQPNGYLNTPFMRFHTGIEEDPHWLQDVDDYEMYYTENFDRIGMFAPKEGTTKGESSVIPLEDDDTKYQWADIFGETLYSNPPDENVPATDMRMDEEFIWAFPYTGYN
mmetsp:Transcript_4911/g.3505  ORF Transcript_4911/g.3505 Transcript_4911/m.3505 type:complete len:118 (+) Transcript_4911:401-754(+)